MFPCGLIIFLFFISLPFISKECEPKARRSFKCRHLSFGTLALATHCSFASAETTLAQFYSSPAELYSSPRHPGAPLASLHLLFFREYFREKVCICTKLRILPLNKFTWHKQWPDISMSHLKKGSFVRITLTPQWHLNKLKSHWNVWTLLSYQKENLNKTVYMWPN